MELIDKQEVIENEITYIVETYDNGTINKYIEPDSYPPAPIKQPLADVVQRGHTEVSGTSIVIPLDPVDVSKATVSLDVQGAERYAYQLEREALTVTFTEPVQAWINWEVRG